MQRRLAAILAADVIGRVRPEGATSGPHRTEGLEHHGRIVMQVEVRQRGRCTRVRRRDPATSPQTPKRSFVKSSEDGDFYDDGDQHRGADA